MTLAAGCTGGGDRPSSAGEGPASTQRRQVDTLRAMPFGEAAIDIATGVLTDAGVGVHDDETEVTTGKPVRVTRWQLRNLATEAANGGGVTGAALAAMAPVPEGAPPVPYLIAAWIKAHDSAGARFSRELMGEQDWTQAERTVFPNLVLTLFLADAAAGAQTPPSPPARSMALAALVKVDVCTFASTFIQHAIADIAKALKVNTSSGGFLGLLGTIWNVAVELAAGTVKGLVDTFTKPVVDAIADVFGVVATITQVSSFLVKWRAELRADPSHNRFGVDSETVTGQFQLTVAQKQLPIPEFVLKCADAVNVDLRNAGSAAGSTLTWRGQNRARADLSTRTGADDVLGKDKTARYRYQTGQEPAELAKSSATQSPALEVTVRVHRNDVAKVRKLFETLLFDKIPPGMRDVVQGLAKPWLDRAGSHLDTLTDLTASARTFITYHTAEPSPSASPPKPGTGSGTGGQAVMPSSCPHVSVITQGFPRGDGGGVGAGPWEFDGEAFPAHLLDASKTCGYSAWLGPKDPVTGFQQVEQVGLYFFPKAHPMPPGAREVSIPGTDRAWFEGVLKVVIGDRTLVIEIRARATMDIDQTALKVARAVLSVS